MVKHTQTIRRLLSAKCLGVFDHFVGLTLKGLKWCYTYYYMVNLLCAGRRLNVNDMFRKHPGILLNVSRTFSLRPVHRDIIWIAINRSFLKPGEDPAKKFYRDFKL